jgi:hypothetical protein
MVWLFGATIILLCIVLAGRAHSRHLDAQEARWRNGPHLQEAAPGKFVSSEPTATEAPLAMIAELQPVPPCRPNALLHESASAGAPTAKTIEARAIKNVRSLHIVS